MLIQHVLKIREAKLLNQITKDFGALSEEKGAKSVIDEKKLKSMGEMIFAANIMLEVLMNQKDLLKYPLELEK